MTGAREKVAEGTVDTSEFYDGYRCAIATLRGMEQKPRPGYCAGNKAKIGAGPCPVCNRTADERCLYGDYNDYAGIADRLEKAVWPAGDPESSRATGEP